MSKLFFGCLICIFSCSKPITTKAQPISEEFKNYWYDNTGEISSYDLQIARYGEIRDGAAVMIFVTEHHSPTLGTKPDTYQKDQVPVLKLNSTMNFITGIYPYSIMTSSFMPVENAQHSLKVTSSIQEWCGHAFMEMKNDKKLTIDVASYFDGENTSDSFEKTWIEDDLFSIIRINPERLPTGDFQMIPSFYKIRMSHMNLRPYRCTASMKTEGDKNTYFLNYPELERTYSISFENSFPYRILSWEETGYSGFGAGRKKMTSTATLKNTIKSTYWSLGSAEGAELRKELELEK